MVKKSIIVVFLILLFLGGFSLGSNVQSKYFQPLSAAGNKANFLILGINGGAAGDADLTDTIIFASLDGGAQKATLISVPRDIWVKEIQAKINTAYHYGGFEMAKKNLSDVLGQKIDYVVILNFDDFEKAIDVLGGIEVDVQRTFDDYKYPIAGKEKDLCDGDKELKCRYEHVHFEKGKQTMDGATALKFVRSRNAVGDEGTDFARSLRQQAVLDAFKQKLQSKSTLTDPKKMLALYQTFSRSAITDLKESEYGSLIALASKIDWNNMKSFSLNGDFLIHPAVHYSNQWVLIPRSGDFKEIQNWVNGVLK